MSARQRPALKVTFPPSGSLPPMLLLRDGGAQAPLVIAHGLMGDMDELAELVRHIATDQAIYAVPPLPSVAHEAAGTVEAVAEHYIEELRTVQSCGPYRLVGYSFGGLVALEMARSLARAGEEVGLLMLVDCYLHPRHWPTASRLGVLWRLALHHAAVVARMAPWRAIPYALRKLGKGLFYVGASNCAEAPTPRGDRPEGMDESARDCLALARYEPEPYAGPVTLIAARARLRFPDAGAVWRGVLPNLTLQVSPGDHADMLTTYATSLAAQLSAPLQINQPERIAAVALAWADRSPDRMALVGRSGSWTYGQLKQAVGEARDWLVRAGVRPGDRVMIVNENCRALVALFLAVTDIDAWPVVVNARLADREIDALREHSGARRVIYSPSPASEAHRVRHGSVVETVGLLGPIGLGALNEATVPEPVEASGAQQVAALVYTSGTTGQPKGVMLTHRNLLFMAQASAAVRRLGPSDRIYGVLPVSHIVGLSVLVLGALSHGATLCLWPRFDAAEALAALRDDGITVMLGVPAMFARLIEYARTNGIEAADCPALRLMSSSGAPLDMTTKAATEALFGLDLHNGYGITECAPTIAQTRPEMPRSDCSVGPVLPGVEVRLLRADGTETVGTDVGEVWVRGPNVMKGYYRADAETQAALDPDGWFNTRDLARFDGEALTIVGRTRELIIRSGFNVYPAEVEAVLNAHPAVLQSAVVGRTVEGNEEVIGFVQPRRGCSVNEAELAAHAANELAPYKRPARIFQLSALPASSTGKILKSQLVLIAAAMLVQDVEQPSPAPPLPAGSEPPQADGAHSPKQNQESLTTA